MKRCKKTLLITMMILTMGLMMTGCGTDKTQNNDGTQNEMNDTNNTQDNAVDDADEADGNPAGESNGSAIENGTNDMNETDSNNGTDSNPAGEIDGAGEDGVDGTGNTDEDQGTGSVGEAVNDVADGVGEAADDLGEGIGDAVDNLGGGSFDSYDDAKKYLLEKLGKDNASANYEVREEKKDLVSYNNSDADARGYEFSVYETDQDEKIGIYYVDKETGKIYRYMGKDSIESY